MSGPRVLAFHAEELHDSEVWGEVARAARWLARNGLKATFFVYPFRAQVAGKDITERVQELASLGHEIGQHTHFYSGKKVSKPDKIDDLSETNIVRCVTRDFETLQKMGFAPKGFTAGAWFVNRTVLDAVVELGFLYDCSAQFPKPKAMEESTHHSWLRCPESYTNAQGQVICLPTTCSLGEWFKWGRHVRTGGALPYQLIYLHDYDLLSFRNRLLLSCFLRLAAKGTLKHLATLVQEQILKQDKDDVDLRSCE